MTKMIMLNNCLFLGSKLVEIQYESRFIFENFALASQKEIICSWNKSKIAIFEFETKVTDCDFYYVDC